MKIVNALEIFQTNQLHHLIFSSANAVYPEQQWKEILKAINMYEQVAEAFMNNPEKLKRRSPN